MNIFLSLSPRPLMCATFSYRKMIVKRNMKMSCCASAAEYMGAPADKIMPRRWIMSVHIIVLNNWAHTHTLHDDERNNNEGSAINNEFKFTQASQFSSSSTLQIHISPAAKKSSAHKSPVNLIFLMLLFEIKLKFSYIIVYF